MNFNLLRLEFKRDAISWLTVIGLIASLIYGGGIVYSIYKYSGPFSPSNVSGVYSTCALLVVTIICIKNIVSDIQSQINYYFLSNKKDRVSYLLAKLLKGAYIGIIFGIGGMGLLIINSYINNQSVSTEVLYKILVGYTLYGMFYSTLIFLISLYFESVINITLFSFFFSVFLPQLISSVIVIPDLSRIIENFLKTFPIYSLGVLLPTVNISYVNILICILYTLILAFSSFYLFPKKDY